MSKYIIIFKLYFKYILLSNIIYETKCYINVIKWDIYADTCTTYRER